MCQIFRLVIILIYICTNNLAHSFKSRVRSPFEMLGMIRITTGLQVLRTPTSIHCEPSNTTTQAWNLYIHKENPSRFCLSSARYPNILQPSYFLAGLFLTSSSLQACNMILFGCPGVMPVCPLDQSYETA